MNTFAGELVKPKAEGSWLKRNIRKIAQGIMMAGDEIIGLPPEVAAEIHRAEERTPKEWTATIRHDESDLGIFQKAPGDSF